MGRRTALSTPRLESLHQWADKLATPELRLSLVGTMTLLLLLLYAQPDGALAFVVFGLAVAGVLVRPLMHKPAFWLSLAAFLAVGYLPDWYALDNHKYLITYWCLAVGLSLLSANPLSALRTNGRLLIGLAFLFAVLAKVISPDYLDGSFFWNLLLDDKRFFGVASVIGGVPLADVEASNQTFRDLLVFGDLTQPIDVLDTARLRLLAKVLTWWTLAIEVAVAVLFLWAEDRGPSRWRDPVLLTFIATTYPVAPVVGFAWVLATMGLAQCSTRGSRYVAGLYVTAYVLAAVLYEAPLHRLFSL